HVGRRTFSGGTRSYPLEFAAIPNSPIGLGTRQDRPQVLTLPGTNHSSTTGTRNPMSDLGTQQSSLKALIAKGKEQNYLTFAEVNDHLPESISDPDQVEDIIQMIDDMGIKVYETAPDADQLLLIENEATDELAAAEAAAALAAVENEAGRTTDPVRMYMREMGTVELLTRGGEIAIAKRIEEGLRELMAAMAYFPGTVEMVLEEYEQVEKEGKRLADVLVG